MFYLRLYGVRFMVKDRSVSEKRNPLPLHGLLFPISNKSSFYKHHPTDSIAHTTAFVTPVVEHWLERDRLYGVGDMVKDYSISSKSSFICTNPQTDTVLC